jgi:NTE family protein
VDKQRLGLALGGGGARAFSHIGVLKVITQEHIAVDYLSGSSMGGVMAAAYAAGVPVEKLEAVALDFSNPRNMMRLMDVNPFRRGLLDTRRVRFYLAEKLGLDIQFGALNIPVALTATDCLHGESIILSEGSLLDAVMATCAFPGIFSAVKIGGRWLLDGGMLNNIPVNVVRTLGAQVVIAVNATALSKCAEAPVELEQVHYLPSIFPQLAEDIYMATMIMTNEITRIRLQESPPELIIYPQIPDETSIFTGFSQTAEIIAAGEMATRQALPQIFELIDKGVPPIR